MKSVLKLLKSAPYLFVLTTVTFSSCYKPDPVPYTVPYAPATISQNQVNQPPSPLPPFPRKQDSLSGREFIYNDLVWGTWSGTDAVLEIPGSNLLLERAIEVTIDPSLARIEVPYYTIEFGLDFFPFPVNHGFIYDNNYFGSVFLFAIAENQKQLIGTKVSVKIRVL